MAQFKDIVPLTRSPNYRVDVGLDYLIAQYTRFVTEYHLDVCPDFQRNYVWTLEQKIRFMEYALRGGVSGMDIYINAPAWRRDATQSWCVLVDGKQRLDAAIGFLNNEFPVFGAYFQEYTDTPRNCNFHWYVNDLATYEEVLQWYLDLNSGGTVHTQEELSKVRNMIRTGAVYDSPSLDEIRENANLSRKSIQSFLEKERIREEELKQLAQQAALIKPKGSKRKR